MWRNFLDKKLLQLKLFFTAYGHVSDQRTERYGEEGVGN